MAGFPIVGVGASAGGLEAFTQLLGALTLDTGMAFVLIQHLDPEHDSALTQILSRATSLPVREIEDNDKVEPDHVYVIPRDRILRIANGVLKIEPRPRTRSPHRPIDTFFESLAHDRREQAIGIVLSGTANDGTLGLEAIKAEGGFTFAQDDSAKYSSMPHSAVASGSVDVVLPPAEIARELTRFVKHPFVAGQWPLAGTESVSDEDHVSNRARGGLPKAADPGAERSNTAGDGPSGKKEEEAYQKVLQLLRNHSGVDFWLYKSSTIQRRIARRVVLSNQRTLSEYARFLRGNTKELDALYSDVLISVTSFFRNPEMFDVLETEVLPNLLKQPVDQPLRCWVLGCSTGQEAYSIAMALVEAAEKTPRSRRVQIFATDLNDALLDKARHGLYAKNLVEGISPQRLRRFFEEEDGGYRIRKSLREMVVFARQNLIADPPFARMDLISCRNLLIYLESGLQRKAIPTFHYALKPGGILLLGTSESVGAYTDLFAPVDRKHKIFSKIGSTVSPIGLTLPRERRGALIARVSGNAEENTPSATLFARSDLDAQREADRITLTEFAPPGVLVNADLQVQQFRGQTGAYLEPPSGKASFDLLKMSREGLAVPLRNAIAQARKENKPVRKTGVRVRRNGETRTVHLRVIPLKNLTERSYLILFEEAGKAGRVFTAEAPPAPSAQATGKQSSRNRDLEIELAETRDYLQSIHEQYEVANEELQASNEEVQSTNEELQSLNEELETSKEELESSNEELTTVNEELQNRNNEVNRLNSDLTNLQTSAKLSVILVGRDLVVRRFSTQAEKQFDLLASHVGRPITSMRHGLRTQDDGTLNSLQPDESSLDLAGLAEEVIEGVVEQEREVIDRDGRWHSLRVRPYMTHDNRVDGAVLVFTNIDATKRSELAIAAARDYAESIVETVRDSLLVLDEDLHVERANGAFYRTFKVTPPETIGKLIYDLGNHQWDIPELRNILDAIRTVNTAVEDIEVEHEFESLGRRSMLVNARRLDGGPSVKQRILLAIEDATERRSAVAAKGVLAAIVESSDDAIVSKTLDGIITSWNHGAETLFGYRADEAIGHHITLIIPDDRRSEEDEVVAHMKRGESVEHFDSVRLAKGGRRINVSLAISPVRNASGQIIGASKVARDITDRKLLEDSLRRLSLDLSEEASRKNEFLAMLGHELRNPLSALASGLELMGIMPEDSDRRRDLRSMMTRQTKRIATLLDQLLDIARVISSKIEITKERVSLSEVVRAALEDANPLIEAQKHRLVLRLPPDRDALLMGDPIRLTQVVENLLTNAAKYTDPGGEIIVTVYWDDDTVGISVKDNGIGMSEDLIPHVFEVFTQAPRTLDRSKGGLGLGLPLVQRIVELHGGHVTASSAGLGEGSEFVVTLPRVHERRSAERREREAPGREEIKPRRILVVDDEEDARETLAALLAAEGHETLAVSDGASALNAVGTFDPEVVLLDLGLPEPDGYEVARELRDKHGDKNLLVVAVTGYRADPPRLKSAGFDSHLIKPASARQISELIAVWDSARAGS